MSRALAWTPAMRGEWEQWVAARPGPVQILCRSFPPNRQYWLAPPGQVVSVVAYHEGGTLTVVVEPEDNPHLLMLRARQVFGVPPEDLHELDDAPPRVRA